MLNANLAALLYLVSGVLFILALRGLSSPATSRQGNLYGMIGMGIAVATTLASLGPALDLTTLALILGGAVLGGGVGAVIARRIPMTAMPQLVAAFHSLVGMAAVLVAAAALFAPEAYHIAKPDGSLKLISLIELGIGTAIGAITFSGSVIAFAKLNGSMSGAPILLPARHVINIARIPFPLAVLVGACSAWFGLLILAETDPRQVSVVLFFGREVDRQR